MPILFVAGNKTIEEVGKQVGEAGWEQAKTIWAKLFPKLQKNETALESVQDVTKFHTDEDALASMRLQFRKLFAENEELALEIQQILQRDIVQKVIAENYSKIDNVSQSLSHRGYQEIYAKDNSSISGVEQQG